jgi:FkbM family methyltransferase
MDQWSICDEKRVRKMQKIPSFRRLLKTAIFRIYYYATSIPVPFPRRLSWGDWWLSWNDELGRLLRTNSHESAETLMVQKILQPGMVMVDAGAHRGYFTLLASAILGDRGKVISFEPSPRERQWLWMHVYANRRKNVRIENCALGSKKEVAEFFITLGKQTGCNSLRYPKGVPYSFPIRVPVIPLDEYYSRTAMDDLDFIKLDVEGAERDVLIGGSRCIQKKHPWIMCELSDLRTLRWKYRPTETVKILEKFGYICYFIRPDCRLEPHREKPVYEDNILAVPVEKQKSLAGMI